MLESIVNHPQSVGKLRLAKLDTDEQPELAGLCELLRLPSCTVTCEQLAGSLPMVLMLFGRLPQITQNLKQGHTGQLSLITYMLNVAGSGARVFTVLQELDDKLSREKWAPGPRRC